MARDIFDVLNKIQVGKVLLTIQIIQWLYDCFQPKSVSLLL